MVRQALTAATDWLYAESRVKAPGEYAPTTGQVQADALGIIAEATLHHDLDPGASGARYQVVVHVDAAVLADPDQPGQSALEDGAHCSAEQSRRIGCDAGRVIMKHDTEGRVIEVGARTRTIPPALRRALQSRDHGCRFPGCGSRFTQGHHIKHWANGGPTTLSNLASLCRRHHRAVHEEGFKMERLANGDLEFRHPYGWVLPQAPPMPDVGGDAERTLRAENMPTGVHPDAKSLTPRWDGTPLNLDYAISVMHPGRSGAERGSRCPASFFQPTRACQRPPSGRWRDPRYSFA